MRKFPNSILDEELNHKWASFDDETVFEKQTAEVLDFLLNDVCGTASTFNSLIQSFGTMTESFGIVSLYASKGKMTSRLEERVYDPWATTGCKSTECCVSVLSAMVRFVHCLVELISKCCV